MKRTRLLIAITGLIAMLAMPGPLAAGQPSAWAAPQPVGVVNTTATEGCAMPSPDGLSLYFASNRPRFDGDTRTDLDLWVAGRADADAPWEAPENLGAPINSTFDDLCPTPVRGKGLLFISSRPGGYGLGDLYFTRSNPAHGWTTPLNLGSGVNSALGEAGPSYFEADGRAFLYFSRGADIFASEQDSAGRWTLAAAVAELNTTAGDFRPNVRKDGREIVFDSNRSGGSGGQDLYTATRASVDEPWSIPIRLGDLNTAASEIRASLSWDAGVLYFGRTGGLGGSMDLWVTTRD